MSETIDIETIRRKRADLVDQREKLVAKIARLETEIAELNVTERTVARLIGLTLPAPASQDAQRETGRNAKPDDLPAMTTMIKAILLAHFRRGRRGLAPKEIREDIAKFYWPDVPSEAVGPIAWRMLTRGELEKTPDGLYALPKDKASALSAEAFEVTGEVDASPIETQARDGVFE